MRVSTFLPRFRPLEWGSAYTWDGLYASIYCIHLTQITLRNHGQPNSKIFAFFGLVAPDSWLAFGLTKTRQQETSTSGDYYRHNWEQEISLNSHLLFRLTSYYPGMKDLGNRKLDKTKSGINHLLFRLPLAHHCPLHTILFVTLRKWCVISLLHTVLCSLSFQFCAAVQKCLEACICWWLTGYC